MFHNLILGRALTYIKQHVLAIGVMTALVFASLYFLTEFLKKDKPEEDENQQEVTIVS